MARKKRAEKVKNPTETEDQLPGTNESKAHADAKGQKSEPQVVNPELVTLPNFEAKLSLDQESLQTSRG